jgi:hypothetical protein
MSDFYKIVHHVTCAYLHHSNGTVEVYNRIVLNGLRVIASELRLGEKDFSTILPQVEFFVNHKAQVRLGNRSPIQVMVPTVEHYSPLKYLFMDLSGTLMEMANEKMEEYLTEISDFLPALHKDVLNMTERQRALHRKYANAKRKPIDFRVGDYVLVSFVEKTSHKMHMTWKGPYQVIESIDNWIYKVKDIVNSDELETHASKMQYYSDDKLEITEKYKLQKEYVGRAWIVHQILRERFSNGIHEVLIRWRGFTSLEDTWEPVSTISVDVPQLWKDFVQNKEVAKQEKKAKRKVNEWRAVENLERKRRNRRR